MELIFNKSFEKDLKKIRDKKAKESIQEAIEEIEKAKDITEINNLKKLKGNKDHCRVKVGNFRIGIAIEKETIEFIPCLDRKEIYKYFP